MHPIPTEIDLSPFIGQEILSFTVGKYHLEVCMDDTRLIIEAGFELQNPGQNSVVIGRNSLRSGGTILSDILGATVLSAVWVPNRGVAFRLSTGASFTAIVDSDPYESFCFSVPGECGIVVV